MPDNILDGQGITLLTAIMIVAVALLALVGVFWLIRARSSSTFIRGGKNRMPRLAVLDATAVDTKRRLVLIRRDDVEHLVMIGGPTDIVIESRIPQPMEDQDAFAPPPRSVPLPPSAQPEWQQGPEPVAQFNQPSQPVAPPRQAAPAKPQPQPQSQPQPKSQPMPAAAKPTPAPSQITTAAAASGVTIAATSIHAEAADVLENARNRVFEDPSFDETAFEELTIASGRVTHPQQTPTPAPAPAPAATPAPAQVKTPEPAPPMSPAPLHPPIQAPSQAFTQAAPQSPPPAQWQRATSSPTASQVPPQPAPSQAQPPTQPTARAPGDFESVLAAELSDDLSLDLSDENFFEPLDHEPDFSASRKDDAAAPAAKTDKRPSRDSLEEEMERLLGDLSAK